MRTASGHEPNSLRNLIRTKQVPFGIAYRQPSGRVHCIIPKAAFEKFMLRVSARNEKGDETLCLTTISQKPRLGRIRVRRRGHRKARPRHQAEQAFSLLLDGGAARAAGRSVGYGVKNLWNGNRPQIRYPVIYGGDGIRSSWSARDTGSQAEATVCAYFQRPCRPVADRRLLRYVCPRDRQLLPV